MTIKTVITDANSALAQFWKAHADTDKYTYKVLAITEGE